MNGSPEDLRRTITPDAFSVAPGLLGIPLARPWRRAAAMAVDLVLIALLANARAVFFAVAAGAFLFWIAFRGRTESTASRAKRAGLGCLGAVVVSIAALATFGPGLVPDDAVVFRTDTPGGTSVPISVGSITDLVALSNARDSAAARDAARSLVERYRREGMSPDELLDVVAQITSGADASPGIAEALREAIEETAAPSAETGAEGPAPHSLDSLLVAYLNARRSGDSAAIARLREQVAPEVAEPELSAWSESSRELRGERDAARLELEETRGELEAERQKGLRHTVTNLLDEFGLGLGWSGLYFTFLTGFFRGRTPGKRLFRIRVVRLDGRPLGYWAALERYGGYAAALFTGFEGFLKILWDPNRQGIQDKIAETVVVEDTSATRVRLQEVEAWGPAGRPGRAASPPPAGPAAARPRPRPG
ncbi:MAG: RDD family protein [Gemmatimonadota bacterium]